jgi:hypothetical protein
MSITDFVQVPWVRTLIYVFSLVLAGAFGGHVLARNHYDSMLDEANQKIGAVNTVNTAMTEYIRKQNAAVDALHTEAERKQALAKSATDKARAESVQSQTRAQAVLLSKPPVGVDQCEAARAAFDAELKAERGVK